MNDQKRRFPMEGNFMKGNKEISKSKPNDILYAYLQMISTFRKEDETRFVYKNLLIKIKCFLSGFYLFFCITNRLNRYSV